MKLAQKIAVGYLRIKFRLLTVISKKRAAKVAFRLFCTPPSRDIKELPPIFLQADGLQFDLAQNTIIGYRWNRGGTKKALILHGFESTAINFAAYIEPLLKKGYEVLAFDAPAHGRSSGKRITALVYRDLIKYVHNQYGPLQSLMGHSFGAFASCLALAEIPHDERTRVVLMAPLSQTSTAIDNFFAFLHLDEKLREDFDNVITSISDQPVSWFSISRTLKTIHAKILWINDETDTVTPLKDALKVKAENYSNVQFVVTSGLGHSRIYRDLEVINTVVDFL